jgi:hypothetical protein
LDRTHVSEHLPRAAQGGAGDALTIEFGDAPSKTKRIVVIPGQRMNFGYASKEDEAVEGTRRTMRAGPQLRCRAFLTMADEGCVRAVSAN